MTGTHRGERSSRWQLLVAAAASLVGRGYAGRHRLADAVLDLPMSQPSAGARAVAGRNQVGARATANGSRAGIRPTTPAMARAAATTPAVGRAAATTAVAARPAVAPRLTLVPAGTSPFAPHGA